MKGYKIDVVKKEVIEVELSSDYRDIYKIVDCEIFSCPLIYENGDSLFCDDEGLLKPMHGFFLLENYPQPIAGNGLILGSNEEGESEDAKTDFETIKSQVKFMTAEDAYLYAVGNNY